MQKGIMIPALVNMTNYQKKKKDHTLRRADICLRAKEKNVYYPYTIGVLKLAQLL